MGERRRVRQPEAQLIEPTFEIGAAAGAGMHGDPGRLVDDEDQPVAIEDAVARSVPLTPEPSPLLAGRGRDRRSERADGQTMLDVRQGARYSAASRGAGEGGSGSRSASHSSAPKRRNISGTVISLTGAGWRWLAFSSASIRSQMPTTLLISSARHDRELVAHRLGVPQIEIRRLAAAHDIEQARPVD